MKTVITLLLIAILINGCGLRRFRGNHPKGIKRVASQNYQLQTKFHIGGYNEKNSNFTLN